jgi:hypothetical protein
MRKNKKENIYSSAILVVPGTHRELEISFELVSPELAREWLDSNSLQQRGISEKSVSQYSSQIQKGIWHSDNGESIKFSCDKEGDEALIDGQHRLSATANGDKSQVFMIIRNIDPDHIKSMDLGKKRSIMDILKVNGFVPPPGFTNRVISTVMMTLYQVRCYSIKQRNEFKTQRIDRNRDAHPSPLELYEFFLSNPEIMNRLKKLENRDLKGLSKYISLSAAIVGWYICDVIDEKVADDLLTTMEECVPQTDMGKNCPAFKLLTYIQKAKMADKPISNGRYPVLFLWAADHMIRNSTGEIRDVNRNHMPGQGHEGTLKLVEHMKSLKLVVA